MILSAHTHKCRHRLRWMVLALYLVPRLGAQDSVPHHVGMDRDMAHYLESVAETSTVETARCLLGQTQGTKTTIAAAADAPWIIGPATDSTVMFRWWMCPPGTVGVWHAHPLRTAIRMGKPPGACWLGTADYALLLQSAYPKFSLISVKRGLSCLFVRLTSGAIGQVPIRR